MAGDLVFVGGPLLEGLGAVRVAGLSMDTLLTLFVLPAMFAALGCGPGGNLAERTPDE